MKQIKVIFLDVDGVLNYSKCKDRCGIYVGIDNYNVSLLKQIVDKTQAKIVLVSSWKAGWIKEIDKKSNQDDLANYLDSKMGLFGLEIYDKTEEFYFDRGKGIKQYISNLIEHQIMMQNYVILDDEWFDYKMVGLIDRVIKTNYLDKGLTKDDADKAIKMLNER